MTEQQLQWLQDGIKNKMSFVVDLDLNADGDKTIKLINQVINKYAQSDFIKQCVRAIDEVAQDEYGFCKALFDISCKLVKYRRDPEGWEIVMTPSLLMKVRQGDCKKFTTWICSVLKCKGIPCANKVVNYDPAFGWQHIYAIAARPDKSWLILDPVNEKKFNKEVEHRLSRINFLDGSQSRIHMNKLSLMGSDNPNKKNFTFFGIGEGADSVLGDMEDIAGVRRFTNTRAVHQLEQDHIEGPLEMICGLPDEDSSMNGLDEMGKKKVVQAVKAAVKQVVQKRSPEQKAQAKEKRKVIMKVAKKGGRVIAKGAFLPTRAAFLIILGAGAELARLTPIKFNLAQKIAQVWQTDNGKSVTEIWEKFGGKRDTLKNALVKFSGTQLQGGIYGIEAAPGKGANPQVIIASVAAGAPILGLIIKLLAQKGALKKQDAALAADSLEVLENQSFTDTGELKPDLMKSIEVALPVVQEAVKLDDGGNKAAQQEIKATVTTNDQEVTKVPEKPKTFTEPVEQSRTIAPDQQTPPADQTQTQTTSQGSFVLFNALSIFKGSFLIQFALADHSALAIIAGSAMQAMSIFLLIRKSLKLKTT